jgi:hypothetical protein
MPAVNSRRNSNAKAERLPIGFHPRVFSALGSDLVTNDLVAITELVKNSYDAFASRVDVRFGSDERGNYIEILDDGQGMGRDTIEKVWCMVATPYRQAKHTARRGGKTRRASGEKGLGRLSAARLGAKLEMLTKARGDKCWHVTADWDEIAEANDISACGVDIEEYTEDRPFRSSGTRLRIYGLKSEWGDDRIVELRDHLARMVSPFKQVDGFSIFLSSPAGSATPAEIAPPKFLDKPKYSIHGMVDADGFITWIYAFRPIGDRKIKRSIAGKNNWADIRSEGPSPRSLSTLERPGCGPFAFEFRAWDIDKGGVDDIATNYELKKQTIRADIKAFKGISVYRDGILVLPKSEASRDWLGLDRRRISDVGKRLSTSQVVGYVAISSDANPNIKDTSDRERLTDRPEVHAFEHIILTIVKVMENV